MSRASPVMFSRSRRRATLRFLSITIGLICTGKEEGFTLGMLGAAGTAGMSLPNALPSDSDSTRYLDSLTEEMAYITTKNANSSVMKSAYETSQRSWFSCSSSNFFLAMPAASLCLQARLARISRQPVFYHPVVFAIGDANEDVGDHLQLEHFAADQSFQAIGDRLEHQVGEADAVDGGDEGDRDAAAELARVRQVFHHMDQAQHRAENADSGRIAAGRFPDLDREPLPCFIGRNVPVEYVAHLLRIGAVNHQPQALGQKRRARRRIEMIQAKQSFPARGRAPGGDVALDRMKIVGRRHEHPAQQFYAVGKVMQAALQNNGAERADHHDGDRRRLHQRADIAAFELLSLQNAGQRDRETRYATPVHALSRKKARMREIAWLCS